MARKTYKFRAYPNRQQENKLSMFFGCSRKLYNLYLEWWNCECASAKEEDRPMASLPNYTYFTKQQQYSYLKQCDSVILSTTKLQFFNAVKDFFKSVKGQRKGRKLGFPTFKKKGVCRDSYTTYNNNDAIVIDEKGKHIRLPKLGFMRIKMHREVEGTIKSVNVSRSKAGNYYVVLTVEDDTVEAPLVNKESHADNPSVVGLDMSYGNFVVSSNKEDDAITKYVRLYRKYEKKLARLQRRMSRKEMVGTGEYFTNRYGKEQEIKRRSNNREKARIRLAKLSEHIANKRNEFAVKLALYFARKYDVVVLEDIDMQSQARSLRLGKSANDLGFGLFRQWLEHEARKYDCCVVYADKWFASSQICSDCGYKNQEVKDLSVREWACPQCGCAHDRDRNAAESLRNYFLEILHTAGTAGINACGDRTSTLRETFGQVLSQSAECVRKQEARDLSHG